MKAPACILTPLLLASCATVSSPEPTTGARGLSRMVLTSVEGSTGEAVSLSPEIRKEDLVQARALLSRARAELKPREWESLDRKLTAAEEAWEQFEAVARKAGKPAQVSRGSRGAAEAARVARTGGPFAIEPESGAEAARFAEASKQFAQAAEGVSEGAALSSLMRAGPMLAAIAVLLYPSKVADAQLTPELRAEMELRARLQDVSEAAQQVQSELAEKVEAARRRAGPVSKPVPAAPKVTAFEEAWIQVAGEPPWRPCTHKGTGGHKPSDGRLTTDWILCRYQCGKYEIEYYIFGKISEECAEKRNMDRAEELARNRHQRKGP